MKFDDAFFEKDLCKVKTLVNASVHGKEKIPTETERLAYAQVPLGVLRPENHGRAPRSIGSGDVGPFGLMA